MTWQAISIACNERPRFADARHIEARDLLRLRADIQLLRDALWVEGVRGINWRRVPSHGRIANADTEDLRNLLNLLVEFAREEQTELGYTPVLAKVLAEVTPQGARSA